MTEGKSAAESTASSGHVVGAAAGLAASAATPAPVSAAMVSTAASASREHLWAVVLAAGNGSRVRALTSGPAGVAVPKQYCRFGRPTCMLRWALDRAASVVPRERVVTVVAEEHRAFWDGELGDLPPGNVVVQPRNRGTAAGILLPFLEVLLHRDSRSRVLVLPSDHYVADEQVLRRALREALGLPRRPDSRLVVLGMTARGDDPEYGWILPAPPRGGALRDVAGFVEKPDPQTARELVAAGALLNTLMFVADGSALLRIYEEALPGLLHAFLRLLRDDLDGRTIEGFYERLPVSDFSRDVLQRSPRHLSLLPVPDCGWSDLGTPARIRTFLGAPPPEPTRRNDAPAVGRPRVRCGGSGRSTGAGEVTA